jgi:D-glycero-D-manno-heptose 1,7-bisphosphate phosphatase
MQRGAATDFSNIEFVFLDRDGVINRKPAAGQFVTRWEEFELLPGVEDAIAQMNRTGRKAIVVTNQRGVALGLYSWQDLAEIHEQLQHKLAARGAHLDAIYVCPHDDGQCDCRKPLTGLFGQAFRDFPTAHAANSVVVGDSLRDIEAGRRLGMRTALIDDGTASSSPDLQLARSLAQVCVASLSDFVRRYLCAERRS